MAKKYKPQWFESPFQHAKYTLVRTVKQAKKLGFKVEELLSGSNATTNYMDDGKHIIVYMPYSDIPLISQQGLIIHEAVHIWQEIKNRMREDEPSIEFEAYSIQVISQDLLWLLGESNGRMAQPTT